jgi:hypothetical protein
VEETAQELVNVEANPLGPVGENQLQPARLEDQLAPLLPEQVSEDEEEAEESHGASQQSADGDAGVDWYAGAEGADNQVDDDAGENQKHALE